MERVRVQYRYTADVFAEEQMIDDDLGTDGRRRVRRRENGVEKIPIGVIVDAEETDGRTIG